MTRYMIRTYPKRLWYVEQYIIPSMLKQGIKKEQITVYNDDKCEGNLRACLNAFASAPDDDGGTWYIQDDIVICKDFKERTELYDHGLVCGFSSALYDGPDKKPGAVTLKDAWFSFPCIRIPNKYARHCAEWVDSQIIGNPVYQLYWQNGKNDDWAFRIYIKAHHKTDPFLNIAPNLVDHVDYLLGGGSGGKRKEECRAQYWTDYDVVERLEKDLNGSK